MNIFGLQLPIWVTYITGPLVGAIIGLITNGIAIRMLFRPLHEKKLFGRRLPFTPGIIPKEKPRIARSCGNVVGNVLINEEVLSETLLSPEMEEKLHGTLQNLIDNYKDSEKTISDLLIEVMDEERTQTVITEAKDDLSVFVYHKACTIGLGEKIAIMAIEEIKKSPAATLMMMLGGEAMNGIQGKIADTVDQIIVNQGEAVIQNYIETESDKLLSTKICDIYENHGHKLPAVEEKILQAYRYLVSSALARILQAIDLPKIVEDRINGFDVLELEKILLELMDKELKAIVWLGGLLGMIMGIIMIFI